MLEDLLAKRVITRAQAELGRQLPIAEDVTVEADSAGHTCRRPLGVLVPQMRRLVDRIAAKIGGAPAPDMFEFAASVQVLSRGTLYAQCAARLYELYRVHPSLEAIPAAERVERQILQRYL